MGLTLIELLVSLERIYVAWLGASDIASPVKEWKA